MLKSAAVVFALFATAALAKGTPTAQNHQCIKDGQVVVETKKQCLKDGGKWEHMEADGGMPGGATMKPADAKPAAVKPADSKPADAKPADAKPADSK